MQAKQNMSGLLHLVRGEDQTARNIAKVVLIGVGCVAGIAAAYKAYNFYKDRQRPAICSRGHDGPIITDVTTDPLVAALELKEEGNKLYKSRKYDQAKEMYTRAIERCPPSDEKNLAIFYQNRAACNDLLNLWNEVLSDCNEAIKRDDRYQKAYTRRARAHLTLNYLEQACEDAACGFYLQDKKTKQASDMFEQALQEYAKQQAAELMRNRKPVPIGDECVRAYFSNFHNDPVLKNLDNYINQAGDETRSYFQEACMSLKNKNYNEVVSKLDQELLNAASPHHKESLLLRATLLTLSGCPDRAAVDLDKLINMNDVDKRMLSTALLRRGLIHIANMESTIGIQCMSRAGEVDPDNSDVYHHRGQIALLMQQFDECQKDTKKAMELQESGDGNGNPNVLLQKYMCDLQIAQSRHNAIEMESIMRKMEKLCNKHPTEAECWCLYAQALIFFSQFQEAEDVYSKAVSHCPDNPRIHIQRAAMVLAWKQDSATALEYLERAKAIDPYCEAVYENMALLYLNQGKLEMALDCLRTNLKYARTAPDCQNAFAIMESIKAQILMREKFDLPVPNIFNVMSPGGVALSESN